MPPPSESARRQSKSPLRPIALRVSGVPLRGSECVLLWGSWRAAGPPARGLGVAGRRMLRVGPAFQVRIAGR